MNKICNTYLFKMDGDWDARDCTVVDFYQFLSGNKKNFLNQKSSSKLSFYQKNPLNHKIL